MIWTQLTGVAYTVTLARARAKTRYLKNKLLQELIIKFVLERNVPTMSVKEKVYDISSNDSDINSVQPWRICLKFFVRVRGKEGEHVTSSFRFVALYILFAEIIKKYRNIYHFSVIVWYFFFRETRRKVFSRLIKDWILYERWQREDAEIDLTAFTKVRIGYRVVELSGIDLRKAIYISNSSRNR